MKNNIAVPTEEEECIALVDYLDLLQTQGKVLEFGHIPNSTYTPYKSQIRKNTRLHVSSGLPDYIIVTNKNLIFIEMKRIKGSRVEESQTRWIDAINKVENVEAKVCYGFSEAKEFIDSII